MRKGRTAQAVARAATLATAAALAVAVTGPAAHADTSEVDAQLVRNSSQSILLTAEAGTQMSMDLIVPAADPPGSGTATVTVAVDFAAVRHSITITDHSNACAAQGSGFACHYDVALDSPGTHRIFFSMATVHGAAWANGTVTATAEISGATDPDMSNNSVDFHLDVRTNRVDVVGTSNGGPHWVVEPDGTHLSAMVTTPNARMRVTLAATFDLSQVAHAVEVTGEFTPDPEGCRSLSGSRYRCELPFGGRNATMDPLAVPFGLTVAPRAGARSGVAGQVRVDVEQVGAVDPDMSNNTAFLTVDVAVGHVATRFDTGEATGRVGDTVTVPVTVTNQGTDSVRYAAISYADSGNGLEFAGYEGCADNEWALPGMCSSPEWLAAGAQHTVGIRLTISRCPDSYVFRPSMAAGAGEIIYGTMGRVNVVGCSGGVPGASGGPATPGAPAIDGGVSAAAGGAGRPAGGAGPSAPPSGPAPAGAGTPGWAAPDGEWVAVGEQRAADGGLGLAGLVGLLALLAAARGWRWTAASR